MTSIVEFICKNCYYYYHYHYHHHHHIMTVFSSHAKPLTLPLFRLAVSENLIYTTVYTEAHSFPKLSILLRWTDLRLHSLLLCYLHTITSLCNLSTNSSLTGNATALPVFQFSLPLGFQTTFTTYHNFLTTKRSYLYCAKCAVEIEVSCTSSACVHIVIVNVFTRSVLSNDSS